MHDHRDHEQDEEDIEEDLRHRGQERTENNYEKINAFDEFGFDRTERAVCKEAASLWYKIIDARSQRVSTALVTNIDFESWADYLGDAPLAMAMLDRVVHGATIIKLKGKSYRVPRPGDETSNP